MGVHSEIDIEQKEKIARSGGEMPRSARGTVWYEQAWRILCNNGFGKGEAKSIAAKLVREHGLNAPYFAAHKIKEVVDNGE